MFSGSQQSGFLSIFYSVGSNPLALWDKQVKNGHIRRVIDDEVKSLVLDIGGTNVATTYITCPIMPRASLAVRLPYLVMVIKNMKKYFSFEIQILDDKDMRRRFRVSNFQSTTKVRPFCTTMPIGLSAGWNQVQFNLADFTKRAYGSMYIETVRVQIHANVRIRRIYFTDQLHSDEDLPNEFKLFAPGAKDAKDKKEKKSSKEALNITAQEQRGGSLVPPIKIEQKPDEEIPPPPTPAEESPVVLPAEPGAEEVAAESAPIPAEEAGIAAAVEEVPSEAAASEIPATEGEPTTEEVPTDAEEAAAPSAEGEIIVAAGGGEGEEIPMEIKQEPTEEGEITVAAAEPDDAASPEAGIEAVVEASAEAEAGVTEVPPPVLEEAAAAVTEEVAEETPGALTEETAETTTTTEAPSEPNTEAETTDAEA